MKVNPILINILRKIPPPDVLLLEDCQTAELKPLNYGIWTFCFQDTKLKVNGMQADVTSNEQKGKTL